MAKDPAKTMTEAGARIRELEAENERLRERLEDKASAMRVEVSAKQTAYRDIETLEIAASMAAAAMESVAKRLPAYSSPAETLYKHARQLRAASMPHSRQGYSPVRVETRSGSISDE